MKFFLTFCTCAMAAAGLYGFADMAGDVKNGTMIRYDQGDEEAIALYAVETVNLLEKQAVKKQPEKQVAAKQKTRSPKAKARKEKEKIVVSHEPVIGEMVTIEEVATDVKIDSVPQIKVEEFDYREFS